MSFIILCFCLTPTHFISNIYIFSFSELLDLSHIIPYVHHIHMFTEHCYVPDVCLIQTVLNTLLWYHFNIALPLSCKM